MARDRDARHPGATSFTNLSRRELVQRAAWLLAAGAIPGGMELRAEDISPVMLKLSAYMSEAHKTPLPDKVLQETKHHILDTFAAMISGAELPPGRMALKFAQSYGGPGMCTVVASEILLGPIEAAIVNGELAHSDETDDDYTGGGAHPAARSYRRRWPPVKKRASADSTSRAPWRWAMTSACARIRPSAWGRS